MDYDLSRLGPTEFEHMIQALAIAELGISVTTFGAGKDGGREATFRGEVMPTHDQRLSAWNGYGIVQAKTIRFEISPAKSASAMVAAAVSELDKFVAKAGEEPLRSPAPEYYILATNARLSPDPEAGGVDQIARALENHSVGLLGHAIWHFEHICRLLDRHDGIRRTYAGFITPGDVLSHLLEMTGGTVDLGPILRIHAASQVAAKDVLKLETGEITESGRVRLSDVAIDLPAVDGRSTEVMAVQTILATGDRSLRSSLKPDRPYGYVVIGGPGQGKSTIGQIVAQVYRVGLLNDADLSISPRVDNALASMRQRLTAMKLPMPSNRRWPAVVDLSAFADALLEKPTLTIVEYLARQLRNQAASVTAAQVAWWLKSWPWVLILDGLDEVPARESRDQVVAALEALIIESRIGDWDVLVVCTTRPQGYENEFVELSPESLELRTLTPDEGLKYGRQIVMTKFPGDPEKANALITRLESARSDPTASKLMQTPLQVSILEFLVEELVELPQTRHELFDGYYRAIYARESAKAGHLGKMLRTYSEQMEWVHERVAIELQIQSERTRDAVASISDEHLDMLFRRKLDDQGYATNDIAHLSKELNRATKQRLVLLVPRGDSDIAFEVRSLQEYMAARWLVSDDASQVFERLTGLAPSSYWRNTWLLAAARIYATRPHERDALLERIRQLDTDSVLGNMFGRGARLAIDLLEDDFAATVPAHRRSLLTLAMTQTTRWPGPELKRLAILARAVVNGSDKLAISLVQERLTDGFNSAGRSRLGAVSILRDWANDKSPSGGFARKLLHADTTWRPDPTNKRVGWLERKSVGAILEPFAHSLDPEDRSRWVAVRQALDKVEVIDNVTAAEAITISRAELDLRSIASDIGALDEFANKAVIAQVLSAVTLPHAPAAIVTRRVLQIMDQSVPRSSVLTLP